MPESSRVTMPQLRIGLKAVSDGTTSYLAILDSDELGRFSFASPPAGSYTLVVLDSDYEGELSLATDGKTTFPLVLPIAPLPKRNDARGGPDQ